MKPHQQGGEDVWILGSGFSRHFHSEMPLMRDLAAAAKDLLAPRFENLSVLADVELALSMLQADDPWKTPDEVHSDMALHERVSDLVRREISDAEARDGKDEAMLRRLVNTWHVAQSHVLTFNYDMMVESAAEKGIVFRHYREGSAEWRAKLPNHTKNEGLYAAHLYPILIPHVANRYGYRNENFQEPISTFKYYKLHGSLNYYTYPEPNRHLGMFHKIPSLVEEVGSDQGLVPLIAPPTHDKQAFVQHPMLRVLWKKAADALDRNGLGRIILAGYSLPQSDYMAVNMLRSFIGTNRQRNGSVRPMILVVNPDPDAAGYIKERIGVADTHPVGQITDVAGFMGAYAPKDFVRVHVWDNRHAEDDEKSHALFCQWQDGKITEDDWKAQTERLYREQKEAGRVGHEWFLSREEMVKWWAVLSGTAYLLTAGYDFRCARDVPQNADRRPLRFRRTPPRPPPGRHGDALRAPRHGQRPFRVGVVQLRRARRAAALSLRRSRLAALAIARPFLNTEQAAPIHRKAVPDRRSPSIRYGEGPLGRLHVHAFNSKLGAPGPSRTVTPPSHRLGLWTKHLAVDSLTASESAAALPGEDRASVKTPATVHEAQDITKPASRKAAGERRAG